MPGLTIHYVVALKSKDKNNITNFQDYINGSFYPDFFEKPISHGTDLTKNKDHIEELIYKVDLTKIINSTDLSTDFGKGKFLHLLTDYLFYHELCYKKYQKDNSFYECTNAFGKEFTRINKNISTLCLFDMQYIADEYKKYFVITDESARFFTTKELEDFINHCSHLDLEQELKNIKNGIFPTYDI